MRVHTLRSHWGALCRGASDWIKSFQSQYYIKKENETLEDWRCTPKKCEDATRWTFLPQHFVKTLHTLREILSQLNPVDAFRGFSTELTTWGCPCCIARIFEECGCLPYFKGPDTSPCSEAIWTEFEPPTRPISGITRVSPSKTWC